MVMNGTNPDLPQSNLSVFEDALQPWQAATNCIDMAEFFSLGFAADARTRIKDHVKLVLGAILYPAPSRRWRRFINEHVVLRELAQEYPRLSHKIYRPYLCKRLVCADRVDVLLTHYRQLFGAGLGDLLGQAARSAIPLAEFAGKSGAVFQLHLTAVNDGHREGELTVKLVSQGQCIYASSFVLSTLDGGPCIAIGALQGMRSIEGAAIIKATTRELHGCRPKKLMVWMVRTIGVYFGCANVLLVSNDNRIAVNRRRARRISSNYDETWEEMSAIKRHDGNYQLPCALSAQDIDLLPSHKRAEARRRNTLLAALSMSVTAMLESRRRPAPRLTAGTESAPLGIQAVVATR